MNQRVNIQYSIDMDELDFELERLLAKSRECLNRTHKEFNALTDSAKGSRILSSDTAEKISEIRENLARVDFTLSDVSRVIGSYVTYQLSQEDEDAPATEAAQEPVPNQAPVSPYSSDMYAQNFQGQDPDRLEAAASQLHDTIKNGGIPLPADIDPEVLAEKLEQFKNSIKNV